MDHPGSTPAVPEGTDHRGRHTATVSKQWVRLAVSRGREPCLQAVSVIHGLVLGSWEALRYSEPTAFSRSSSRTPRLCDPKHGQNVVFSLASSQCVSGLVHFQPSEYSVTRKATCQPSIWSCRAHFKAGLAPPQKSPPPGKKASDTSGRQDKCHLAALEMGGGQESENQHRNVNLTSS